MKDKILNFLIQRIVDSFLGSLSPQQIKAELDRLIDRVETLVENSDNKMDDSLLPVLRFVREVFDVPDLPDVK